MRVRATRAVLASFTGINAGSLVAGKTRICRLPGDSRSGSLTAAGEAGLSVLAFSAAGAVAAGRLLWSPLALGGTGGFAAPVSFVTL